MRHRQQIVVMKFGGTSVGSPDALRRLIEIVARAKGAGLVPLVVVSAMSKVTDALLAAAAEAARGNDAAVADELARLAARHHEAARAALGERAAEAERVIAAADAHLEQLRALLRAIGILREASPRSIDAVASTGELVSSRLVAAALRAAGIRAEFVDARRVLVTDDSHGSATPLVPQTEAALRTQVIPILDDATVPVLGGYVGATEHGVTTTLGRGGSDYSAALFAAGVDAAEVQIWTDVDGMLSADPRMVDSPIVVPHLSFDEASELAYFGAKVLHPSTILPAMRKNITVRILNSRRPENPGTRITRDPSPEGTPVTAIACKRRVTVLDITSTRMLMAHGFLRRVFEVFEHYRTSVDVVTTSEVSVSVTVDDDRSVSAIADALRVFADVAVVPNMAILCAVGEALRRDSRVAGRVVAALQRCRISMVSQAASRRNLTVVLPDEEIPSAMAQLHGELFAGMVAQP